ncbi:MAG: leucine-rich repeat protein [Clostridia bacterium]|nr:leucine-rich repeat protein [Clostridia bacterium]
MRIKTLFTFVLVLMLSMVLAVSIFAAEGNLWADKPSTEPLHSGFVVNGLEGHTGEYAACTGTCATHTPTNVRWEVYSEGTNAYALYLFIDDEAYAAAYPEGKYKGNTVLYAYADKDNDKAHGYGWSGSGYGTKHSWTSLTGISASYFKKIVIGDGITECRNGTFVGMSGVTTIEMPTSLVKFNGAVLKGCSKLTTVYTRGQEPVLGTVNLSNLTTITTTNYTFSACASVKQYIFGENTKMNNLSWACFLGNTALESLTIPEGVAQLNVDSLTSCTSLKEVIFPTTLTKIYHQALKNATALEKITFKSDATISYDTSATDKAGVISLDVKTSDNNYNLNSFAGCTALTTIEAPVGSKPYEFAVKYGFEAVEYKGKVEYSGSFENDKYPNATWTWSLYSTGTLIIGGTGANGNTTFQYTSGYDDLSANSFSQIPWYKDSKGKINGIEIKKVIIEESTGITSLGIYSLGYLSFMTELVIPSTVTTLGTSVLSTASSLKTISVHGKTDAGEGIYDLRNIVSVNGHAFAGAASAAKVTTPIEVWFGENTNSLPKATDSWNWFNSHGSNATPSSTMTTKVIFRVYPGTGAETILSAYVARQQKYDPDAENLGGIDKTNTINVELKYYGITGNCKDDLSGYVWEFSEESGLLTISGTSDSTTLGFTTPVNWGTEDQKNSPWYDYRSQIKKVVIEEDTGITAIQQYVFAYLPNCTTIIMPQSVTNLSAYNIFGGCGKLSTIAYSEESAEENVYDLRYTKSFNNQLFEDAAKGLTITLKASSGTLPNKIVRWFSTSTTVNFEVFEDSPMDNWLKDVAAGTDSRDDGYKFTIGEITYIPTAENPLLTLSGTDTVSGNYSWVLDLKTGTLTFTRLKSGWCELHFNKSKTDFLNWLNDWREDIKHIVVPEFSKYQDADLQYPFSNLPNLETVKWDTTRMMSTGATGDSVGMFYGCEKLSTFGTSKTFKIGVVNLSGFSLESINTSIYSKNMFYGCRGIEKVILDGVTYNTGDTAATIVPTIIGKSMFEGCTSLKELEISEAGGIMASAFKNCSALKGDIYYAGDAAITNAFDGCGGIIIRTDSAEKIVAMVTSMTASGVTIDEAMVAGMVHGGFGVRISDYNGLRSFYTFAGETNLNIDGLTLVEYGSICGEVNNYSSYTEDFGGDNSIITLDGTEFKTPNKIVKKALYMAEGYTGELATKKTVNEDGSVTFTVTVTNFAEANYNSDIIMTGYEIWKDSEGNYLAIYTKVDNEDYKKVSLRKVTLGMLIDSVIKLGTSGPVYDVVNASEKVTMDVGMEGVEAYLIDHHLKDGKKIAVYTTTLDGEIDIPSLGIPTGYIGLIADYIFDGNIICSAIPQIDDYWREHIDAQLATLPEGRSFIAITDTHYPSNAGKSADLMEYVRRMTGIKKVVNLGDPYHDGATHDIALSNLELSMETKFFDYFGEDGMFAVGNHDSNLTKARTSGDDNANTYKMDLLLSDREIYDRSFIYVEDGGKKNENVVYDEALLAIIEANKSEIKEFVLDNVAAEDAASFNNMFGDVSYTAEEMYDNLVCWAKMHYAYYDHESKICYIVLNTGGLTVTDFAILNRELWKFHPSQYEFLNTMLNEISEKYSDYDVVVAGHMFYDKSVANESYNSSLFKMLSAFEGGTSVSFSASGNNAFSGKLFGCENGASSRTLSYDFSNREFTGEVVCITGHRHIDLDLVSQTKDGKYYMSVPYGEVENNLSDNAIQLILLNQDNYAESKSDVEADSESMKKGTITEHCFTIFTFTDDNTLVATRIGANDGNKQKTYKLGDYEDGWTFTASDNYKVSETISTWPKTLEAVINVPTSITGRSGVVFGNYSVDNHFNFEIESNGVPRFYINGKNNLFSNVDIRSDELVHVAITVENIDTTARTATLKCYINGELAQTIENAPVSYGFEVSNLIIGGDNRSGNAQYFKGRIRYAAAYSYARSAEQIAADYQNFGGDDPMFCYDLSDRKMSEMKDVSGNGFDAVNIK